MNTAFTPSIILVEDDLRLSELVSRFLESNGFRVAVSNDGDHVVEQVLRESPDLVILDLGLPGQDGLTICKELRPAYQNPILILTARDNDIDHVLGLELGADDYVIKPVEPRVLMARINALLRRSKTQLSIGHKTLRFGRLVINTVARSVTLDNQSIPSIEQRIRPAGSVWLRMPERFSRARRFSSSSTGGSTTARIGCWTFAYRICGASSAMMPTILNGSRPSGGRDICSFRTHGEEWRATSSACTCSSS